MDSKPCRLAESSHLGILNRGASRSWLVRRLHTGVDSAFDFRTQVPHGPGAVRLLVYRLCDTRERVQSTDAIHLNGGCRRRVPRKSVTSPVTRRGRRSRQSVDSGYDFWSGARDLNPGPHGPEPCWLCVLWCPGGSADARQNSNCCALVSVRVLLDPPGAGNLCPGCAPASASKGGNRRPPRTRKWHYRGKR